MKTHSSVWATASGSEASATRGHNDALIRILSVATAQDGEVVTMMKRSAAGGRSPGAQRDWRSVRMQGCREREAGLLTTDKRRAVDDVTAVSTDEAKR